MREAVNSCPIVSLPLIFESGNPLRSLTRVLQESQTAHASACFLQIDAQISPSRAAEGVARQSLQRYGIDLKRIDYVISCTQTPDYNNPGLVSCLLSELKLSGIPGLELKQFVTAPLYAIDLASKLIRSARASCVLITCVDLFRRYYQIETDQQARPAQLAAKSVLSDGAAAFFGQR